MFVTVIVPVFNKRASLERCVRSLIQQTFLDFDVILVNDGSTDGSDTICDEIAHKFSRFSVVHQSNGGVSSARNAGIEKSKGDWITFLDADDVFMPYRLEKMVDTAKKLNPDVIFDNIALLRDGNYISDSYKPFWPFWHKKNNAISLDEMVRCSCGLGIKSYGLLKPFIKRSFIEENNLKYDLRLKQSEDFEFYMKCFFADGAIVRVAEIGYLYDLPAPILFADSISTHASQKNIKHRALATEIVLENGWSKLTYSQILWLKLRLKNWNSFAMENLIKYNIRSHRYFKALMLIFFNPWFIFKRLASSLIRQMNT